MGARTLAFQIVVTAVYGLIGLDVAYSCFDVIRLRKEIHISKNSVPVALTATILIYLNPTMSLLLSYKQGCIPIWAYMLWYSATIGGGTVALLYLALAESSRKVKVYWIRLLKFSQDEEYFALLPQIRWLATNFKRRGILIYCAAVLLLNAIPHIVLYAAKWPREHVAEFVMLLNIVILYATFVFLMWVNHRISRWLNDVFCVMWKLKVLCLSFAVSVIAWGLNTICLKLSIHNESSYYASAVLWMCPTIIVANSVYVKMPRNQASLAQKRTHQQENNLKNVKFRDIFMFHDILEKFVLHVFSEWSPENFYFYRDVVILQALFLNEGPGATEEMRSKFAGIYNEYVKLDSSMAINVSHPTRELFRLAAKASGKECFHTNIALPGSITTSLQESAQRPQDGGDIISSTSYSSRRVPSSSSSHAHNNNNNNNNKNPKGARTPPAPVSLRRKKLLSQMASPQGQALTPDSKQRMVNAAVGFMPHMMLPHRHQQAIGDVVQLLRCTQHCDTEAPANKRGCAASSSRRTTTADFPSSSLDLSSPRLSTSLRKVAVRSATPSSRGAARPLEKDLSSLCVDVIGSTPRTPGGESTNALLSPDSGGSLSFRANATTTSAVGTTATTTTAAATTKEVVCSVLEEKRPLPVTHQQRENSSPHHHRSWTPKFSKRESPSRSRSDNKKSDGSGGDQRRRFHIRSKSPLRHLDAESGIKLNHPHSFGESKRRGEGMKPRGLKTFQDAYEFFCEHRGKMSFGSPAMKQMMKILEMTKKEVYDMVEKDTFVRFTNRADVAKLLERRDFQIFLRPRASMSSTPEISRRSNFSQ